MESKNYFLILRNELKGFLINHWNQQQYLQIRKQMAVLL